MREANEGGTPLVAGQRVAVQGNAPDGSLRWSFAGEVLGDGGDEIVLGLRAGEPVSGPEPWSWPADGRLHLWRSRPYSVLATTRAGRFPYWYCAVHTPAVVLNGGDEIRVVDRGLDVQLFADGRYSVGGEETVPADGAARAAVEELVALMKAKAPPFGTAGGAGNAAGTMGR